MCGLYLNKGRIIGTITLIALLLTLKRFYYLTIFDFLIVLLYFHTDIIRSFLLASYEKSHLPIGVGLYISVPGLFHYGLLYLLNDILTISNAITLSTLITLSILLLL